MDLSYNDYFTNADEFVDSIPGGFCIYNGMPSVYTEVNDIACQRLDYTSEELCSMSVYDTNPSLNKEKVKELLKTISENGNVIYETLAKAKNGKIMPVEINSISMVLNDEKYVLSISKDITERKKTDIYF
jgi:PAS domain S-box-containing protein